MATCAHWGCAGPDTGDTRPISPAGPDLITLQEVSLGAPVRGVGTIVVWISPVWTVRDHSIGDEGQS